MFRRLIDYLMGAPGNVSSTPIESFVDGREEFSFESLWDDCERRYWNYDAAAKSLGASNPRLLNWIGSINYSGYTREKCLRWLIANREPGDENRILLRLTDWVPQVQVIARDWVLEHFHELPNEAIYANQRLILYLSRKDRLQEDEGMRAIERDLLVRAKAMGAAEFFELIPMFRRYTFSLSLANDGQLRPWILDDPEPFNRLLLLNNVEFANITYGEIQRLRADKSIFVRRRFFRAQLKSGVKPERDELTALAVHPNQSLRELGQYYLKSIYGDDAYAIYHASDGNEFYYIADYARADDAEHFLDGIRTGSRLTRLNCLRALATSAPERLKELNIPELIGQNRRFRAVLVPLLPRLLSLEEILALRPVFEACSPQGILSFFRLLNKKSFWAFVDEGLAVLLGEPEPALRNMIVHGIHSQVSVPGRLSAERRESIHNNISKLRSFDKGQNGRVADLIEFTIKNA